MAHPVLEATLDGRPMEGTTDPEPLEHSVLVKALDSGLMDGMSSLVPLEQLVLNSVLVTRPMEGTTDTDPSERSALATHLDYGLLNLESPAHPVVDVVLDGWPMEGITDPHPLETSGLVMALGSGFTDYTSGTETAVVNGPDMDDFCQWTESSDEDDCFVSYVGSNVDISLNLSEQEDLIHTDVESVIDFDSDDSVMDFCIDSNEGSVAELEWNTWDEA